MDFGRIFTVPHTNPSQCDLRFGIYCSTEKELSGAESTALSAGGEQKQQTPSSIAPPSERGLLGSAYLNLSQLVSERPRVLECRLFRNAQPIPNAVLIVRASSTFVQQKRSPQAPPVVRAMELVRETIRLGRLQYEARLRDQMAATGGAGGAGGVTPSSGAVRRTHAAHNNYRVIDSGDADASPTGTGGAANGVSPSARSGRGGSTSPRRTGTGATGKAKSPAKSTAGGNGKSGGSGKAFFPEQAGANGSGRQPHPQHSPTGTTINININAGRNGGAATTDASPDDLVRSHAPI